MWWHGVLYWISREEDKTSTWIEVAHKIETIIETITGTAIPLIITVTTTILTATEWSPYCQ